MQINTVPKNFIINVSFQNRGKTVSDFLLHGLSIRNDGDTEVQLEEICFGLYASELLVKQISYKGSALENMVLRFSEDTLNLDKGFIAKLFLGEEDFFRPACYTTTLTLKPGQETGIFNEYFVLVYEEIIDLLTIQVTFHTEGQLHVQELRLPVVTYKSKNPYIFPLKGSISACGNYNCLLDHRQHYSMEFAIDMAQYNKEQKLCYKEDMKEEDYIVFGKEILAIAEGVVVACYSSFAMVSSWNWQERKPYIEQYGLAAQCGNYIVLEHDNGEYSFYGHLIKDSLTVSLGDKVTQGQPMARVGHTGLSNCPHLHFQLMDGPDFLSSRGLPCTFINIKDAAGNFLGLIQEDNLIIHAD